MECTTLLYCSYYIQLKPWKLYIKQTKRIIRRRKHRHTKVLRLKGIKLWQILWVFFSFKYSNLRVEEVGSSKINKYINKQTNKKINPMVTPPTPTHKPNKSLSS
jgi:hypothetical protein